VLTRRLRAELASFAFGSLRSHSCASQFTKRAGTRANRLAARFSGSHSRQPAYPLRAGAVVGMRALVLPPTVTLGQRVRRWRLWLSEANEVSVASSPAGP
jgi:hypothetical protein